MADFGLFTAEELVFISKLLNPAIRATHNDYTTVHRLERKYLVDLDELLKKVERDCDFLANLHSKLVRESGGAVQTQDLFRGRRQ